MKRNHVIAIVSGKGGVGKTTLTANFGIGLAKLGKKVLIIDFDVGQRNMDMILGVENRILFDSSHVLDGTTKASKAVMNTKFSANLKFLAASQTKDKTSLKSYEVKNMLDTYKSDYDIILLDAPAGIEAGFDHSVEFADVAIIVINPEVSSIRDADRAICLLDEKAILGENIKKLVVVNRVDKQRVNSGQMMSSQDIVDVVEVELLGEVPNDIKVIEASNTGQPTIEIDGSLSGNAFFNLAIEYLGDEAVLTDYTKKEEDVKKETFFTKLKRIFKND